MEVYEPLISVIIPCYNPGVHLRDSIESVLGQTHRNIEVIVVNDGSTDDSENLVRSIKDKRIRYYLQDNSGQSAASNFGLENARGDYIKFFDADDIMNEEHLAAQLSVLNGDAESLAFCAWGRFYDDDVSTLEFIPDASWKSMKPMDWLKSTMSGLYDMMPAWLWLIPRQLIEKTGGWDPLLSLNNDFEFSTRLLTHASYVYFSEDARLYYRSGVQSSLSKVASEKTFESAFLSAKMGCGYVLNRDDSAEMKLLCANKYCYWLYLVYPRYPLLVNKIEKEIKALGGASRRIDESPLMHRLQKLFGWKAASQLKRFFYRIGYKKYLLAFKKKLFPPTISHR